MSNSPLCIGGVLLLAFGELALARHNASLLAFCSCLIATLFMFV